MESLRVLEQALLLVAWVVDNTLGWKPRGAHMSVGARISESARAWNRWERIHLCYRSGGMSANGETSETDARQTAFRSSREAAGFLTKAGSVCRPYPVTRLLEALSRRFQSRANE